MGQIEDRLTELGVELRKGMPTAGNYVPAKVVGNFAYTAGVIGSANGGVAYPGALGGEVSVEEGQLSARAAAISGLSVLAEATGDLDRIEQIVRLTGYVRATPDFTNHPQVVDGASNFLGEVFGDRAKHVRSAVGVASLPFNGSVELELIVALKD